MKCVSCETEINPKWRHAINQNICPFCGQSIMEELLKSLLSTLQEAMEKLQAYPDQLNDWLLSNYNFIKTDSLHLKNYVPKEILKEMKKEHDGEEFEKKRTTIKVKTDQGEEEVVTEKIQSDSKTASFFERAEVTKRSSRDEDESGGGNMGSRDGIEMQKIKSQKPPTFKTAADKTEYIKSLKKKIEKHGSQVAIDETGLAAMISPEMLENADSEAVAEYGSMISSGDIVASGLPVSSGGLDDEDAMANRVLSMNLAAASQNNSKGSNGGYNAKDAAALQNLVDKAKGNSGGSFSRRG